jgi:hypothetical protein
MILGDQAGCLLTGIVAVGDDGWDSVQSCGCGRGTHGGGLPFSELQDVARILKVGAVGASGEAQGLLCLFSRSRECGGNVSRERTTEQGYFRLVLWMF